MKFNRIHIIGGPGSGKSYMGKKLAKKFKCQHFDLDDIRMREDDTDYSKTRTEAESRKILRKLTRRKKWIFEGVYSDWVDTVFNKADRIIVLKPRKYLKALRIIKRMLKVRIGLLKRKKSSLKHFYGFLKWGYHFDKNDLLEIEKRLKKHKKKVRYFNKADIAIKYILRNNK